MSCEDWAERSLTIFDRTEQRRRRRRTSCELDLFFPYPFLRMEGERERERRHNVVELMGLDLLYSWHESGQIVVRIVSRGILLL